ncbi:DNA recombination and repair protein Rad51 C-terminal [Penicillium malachiteum]|uniref:DNA recombination and repair protein Rad51 C-terminal n=1 Tax=Penicillium malachiteum TaxID=1324776 RepID=A0AAD6HMV9_9EURO|nr:DNA recombination and repair protein Rad51 C-terminal [Penicillium malachiteum]
MDLLSVLPGFATNPYAHILPPLERSKITTVDLITLDTLEIAKRAHVPPADVRRLCVRVVEALHADLGFEKTQTNINVGDSELSSSINPETETITLGPATKLQTSWNSISTLDPTMDALLGGGIPTGYVTEVTGESGSGKTQFLLSLLLAVQLPKPHGLQKNAIYISTEHPLATNRLEQLMECHPYLASLPADQAPTLQNVLSINAMDLETQDHILNYQLPVAIDRYNVGLVIMDSITSNYRAEHTNHSMLALSARSTELAKLGQMLRNLAAKENIAIIVANQVSDRFEPIETVNNDIPSRSGFPSTQGQGFSMRESGTASPLHRNRADLLPSTQQSPYDAPSSSSPASSQFPMEDDQFDGSYIIGNAARNDLMSLLHQERFFTGWGDSVYRTSSLKTPALGFFWSTQIACRIALKKQTHSMFVPWEGAFPLSTPLEQTGTQELKGSVRKPGFLSARETHTGEPKSEFTTSDEKDTGGKSPVEDSLEQQLQRARSPPPPETRTITKRIMKVVFAPWTAGPEKSQEDGADGESRSMKRRVDETAFEIWKGGLRSIESDEF